MREILLSHLWVEEEELTELAKVQDGKVVHKSTSPKQVQDMLRLLRFYLVLEDGESLAGVELQRKMLLFPLVLVFFWKEIIL